MGKLSKSDIVKGRVLSMVGSKKEFLNADGFDNAIEVYNSLKANVSSLNDKILATENEIKSMEAKYDLTKAQYDAAPYSNINNVGGVKTKAYYQFLLDDYSKRLSEKRVVLVGLKTQLADATSKLNALSSALQSNRTDTTSESSSVNVKGQVVGSQKPSDTIIPWYKSPVKLGIGIVSAALIGLAIKKFILKK